eukprot:4424048-Ditylum_brightwellii.AAC.1
MLPLKRLSGRQATDNKLAATARSWLWQQQTKMVMPSQSKWKWGAGKKEPVSHDFCGEMLWRCSWNRFPLQV